MCSSSLSLVWLVQHVHGLPLTFEGEQGSKIMHTSPTFMKLENNMQNLLVLQQQMLLHQHLMQSKLQPPLNAEPSSPQACECGPAQKVSRPKRAENPLALNLTEPNSENSNSNFRQILGAIVAIIPSGMCKAMLSLIKVIPNSSSGCISDKGTGVTFLRRTQPNVDSNSTTKASRELNSFCYHHII